MSESPLAAAQTLPFDIVMAIVDRCVGVHDFKRDTNRHALLSILHTCHSWRAAFIRRCYSHVCLVISESAPLKIGFRGWPGFLCPPSYPISHMVRRLYVYVNSWSMLLNSRAMVSLLSSGCADMRFPAADSLSFEITTTGLGHFAYVRNPTFTIMCMLSFFKRLKQMAPNINSLEMNWASIYSDNIDEDALVRARKMFAETFSGVFNISLSTPGDSMFAPFLFLSDFVGIRRFVFLRSADCDSLSEFVRRNAQTLRRVRISFTDNVNIYSLLYDNNNTPVEYPQLVKLAIDDNNSGFSRVQALLLEQAITPAGSATHFPRLERLYYWGIYNFTNDVLFRGTDQTLKLLDITISDQLMNVIMRYGLLFQKPFPHLRSLRFNKYGLGYYSPFSAVYSGFVSQVLSNVISSSPELQHIKMMCAFDRNILLRWVDACSTTYCRIQTLSIPEIELDFAQLVTVIKSIPFLMRLACRIATSAPVLDGISGAGLLEYVLHSVCPLNKNFCTLQIRMEYIATARNNIKLVIALIAIACPNFYQAYSYYESRNSLVDGEYWVFEDDIFQPYMERIRSVHLTRGRELKDI